MSIETLGGFTDHPRKVVFRGSWAKPLLKFMAERLDKKLVYLGLPGVDALDVKIWIDYLRVVIAFQAFDEDEKQEVVERDLKRLQQYLNECETSGKLDNYVLYQGFLEQVIMGGTDDTQATFNQNDYITVYNLDFCNTLTSPYPVLYAGGRTGQCTKLDVVDKLLEVQSVLPNVLKSDKFLMYLTVNSNFLERNFDTINLKEYKDYKKRLSKFPQAPQTARLIKAYAFYYLNTIFQKHGFQAEFLPTMYYRGSGERIVQGTFQRIPTMMLTFTILGSRIADGQAPYQQNLAQFLKCKFLFADDSKISCYTEKRFSDELAEEDFSLELSTLMQESHTVSNLWK